MRTLAALSLFLLVGCSSTTINNFGPQPDAAADDAPESDSAPLHDSGMAPDTAGPDVHPDAGTDAGADVVDAEGDGDAGMGDDGGVDAGETCLGQPAIGQVSTSCIPVAGDEGICAQACGQPLQVQCGLPGRPGVGLKDDGLDGCSLIESGVYCCSTNPCTRSSALDGSCGLGKGPLSFSCAPPYAAPPDPRCVVNYAGNGATEDRYYCCPSS